MPDHNSIPGCGLAIPPFFFRLAFPDIGSVGRIEKKKKLKKNHKKSQNRRPWYARTTLKVNIHIFGLTKYTIYRKKCSSFFYAVTMLIFQMKIIFQVKIGLT